MFSGMFWVKYFFRVLHIGSLVTLCQAIITAKLTGEVVKGHSTLYMTAGIVAIVSGLVNTYILKPSEMGNARKLWKGFHHFKALTAILIFTPAVKMLPFKQTELINIKFYWMVTMLLVSPFARFYREFFVAKEKQKRQREIKEEDSG